MQSNKKVIFGEASESDGEDVTLDEISQTSPPYVECEHEAQDEPGHIVAPTLRDNTSSYSSLISSSTATIAKILNYSSSSIIQAATGSKNAHSSTTKGDNIPNRHLSPLHTSLFTKNKQLYCSLCHIQRHPFEKASHNIHSISQRLVDIQRTIQHLGVATAKLGRSQDYKIDIQMLTGY